jgi:hypothetical protein
MVVPSVTWQVATPKAALLYRMTRMQGERESPPRRTGAGLQVIRSF